MSFLLNGGRDSRCRKPMAVTCGDERCSEYMVVVDVRGGGRGNGCG